MQELLSARGLCSNVTGIRSSISDTLSLSPQQPRFAREAELVNQSLHEGVTARPLEWKYVLQYGCKLLAESFPQQAPRAVESCLYRLFS